MSPVLQASIREQKKLLVENAKLKNDIAQLRSQLQDKQDKKRRAGTVSCSRHFTTLCLVKCEFVYVVYFIISRQSFAVTSPAPK